MKPWRWTRTLRFKKGRHRTFRPFWNCPKNQTSYPMKNIHLLLLMLSNPHHMMLKVSRKPVRRAWTRSTKTAVAWVGRPGRVPWIIINE
ncbi:unnamed protein product [Nesidiocoris tenuis]|uniref:Uncharacterized protein n=1 Tax=Nesidiocoris tenuis TaxID=355587 RepID=A0A6H5GRT4_9HEMI|nr:unnamed protein product [Nesidiocoris tenuis]